MLVYGMKMMSEGVEKFGGEGVGSILRGMRRKGVRGVVRGMLIRGVIEWCWGRRVMVVRFVKGGLVRVCECMGVIMGGNMGRRVRGWII